jgi:fermentation-respiration switch protein FrsA (DUF1100 family)
VTGRIVIGLLIALGVTVAMAALVIVAIVVFQHRLLYFPASATIAEMTRGGLAAWPESGDFRGLVSVSPGTGPTALRGTVLVFHGNAGHAGHRSFYVEPLSALGLRVVLAEYPGYGPRDGEVGEASLVADAERTIELAHRLHGSPLLVIGESLGAGVAAAAAGRQSDKVHALLVITPWDRLENVGSHHYPWLPVRWLLRDRYDTVKNLAAFRRPVTVVLAELDEIVPARFGLALFERLAQPKSLLVVPSAGHNDWPLRVDGAWWRTAIEPLLGAGDALPRN